MASELALASRLCGPHLSEGLPLSETVVAGTRAGVVLPGYNLVTYRSELPRFRSARVQKCDAMAQACVQECPADSYTVALLSGSGCATKVVYIKPLFV